MDDWMDSVLKEQQVTELHRQFLLVLTKDGRPAQECLLNHACRNIPRQYLSAEAEFGSKYLPCTKIPSVWLLADDKVITFKGKAPGNNMNPTIRSFLKKSPHCCIQSAY